MGDRPEIGIVITAADEYSAQLLKFKEDVGGAAQHVTSAFGRLESSLTNTFSELKAKWLEIAAVVASAAWLNDAGKQALETEISLNKLRMQVTNLGLAWQDQEKTVMAVVDATSKYAVVQDDDAARSLQQLIFNSGKYKESLQNLNLVYDLAYQKGIDQSEAAALVGKAMSGNVDALGRFIPELHNLDQTLGANATQAQKSAYALALMEEKVRGAHDAMTPHERQMRETTKAYTEFKEAVGRVVLLVKDFLVGTVNEAAAAFLYLGAAGAKTIELFYEFFSAFEKRDQWHKTFEDFKGAANELMVKGGQLQASALGMDTALAKQTETQKESNKHTKTAAQLGAEFKAANDELINSLYLLEKAKMKLSADSAEERRQNDLELSALKLKVDNKIVNELVYLSRKKEITEEGFEHTARRLNDEINIEVSQGMTRIQNLRQQKKSEEEISKAYLEVEKSIAAKREQIAQASFEKEKSLNDMRYKMAAGYAGQSIVEMFTATEAEKTARMKFFADERNRILYEETLNAQNNEMMRGWAIQSAANVQGAAYKGMETQMLRLIETGRFSVSAFGQIIAQQVKMELVGIAAKAAVWALFETAMGFAMLFVNPPAAGAHFTAAANFAMVSGATLAAAAGVQAIVGGTAAGAGASSSTASTGSGAQPVFSSSPAGYPAPPSSLQGNAQPAQNVTLIVQALDPSSVNWDKLMADNIAPALEKLSGDGNRPLNIQVATA